MHGCVLCCRKIFIGGLSWDTTHGDYAFCCVLFLNLYLCSSRIHWCGNFIKYGEVEYIQVRKNSRI